jgi:hypothetical protein
LQVHPHQAIRDNRGAANSPFFQSPLATINTTDSLVKYFLLVIVSEEERMICANHLI